MTTANPCVARYLTQKEQWVLEETRRAEELFIPNSRHLFHPSSLALSSSLSEDVLPMHFLVSEGGGTGDIYSSPASFPALTYLFTNHKSQITTQNSQLTSQHFSDPLFPQYE